MLATYNKSITGFLSAFYPDENEQITLESIKDSFPITYQTTRSDLLKNKQLQIDLKQVNQKENIYFVVNSKNSQGLIRFNAFFIVDNLDPIDEQHAALDQCPLQPSVRVVTRNAIEAYWLIKDGCSEVDWKAIQAQITDYFESSVKVIDPLCAMKLPFYEDVSFKSYDRLKIEIADCSSFNRFTIEEIRNAFTFGNPQIVVEEADKPLQNSFNSYVLDINSYFVKVRGNEEAIIKTDNSFNSYQSLRADTSSKPFLNTLINDKQSGKEAYSEDTLNNPKRLLNRKCFYGLVGEIVKTIDPHTEADPMALVLNILVAFGNILGRKPFYEVEGSKHYTNLFGILVGISAAGKGISWNQIKRLFEKIDENWSTNQIQSGLSSGEGLISAVKDESGKERDKRLLVVESEFSSVLSRIKRDENTLSAIIRGFWDDGKAQTMTKIDPVSVNEAHISILGHITPFELKCCLSKTEYSNGFGNRFLWVRIEKSKSLPDGGKVPLEQFNLLVTKLAEAVNFASNVGEMVRDNEARDYWKAIYSELTAERYGVLESITARARAQVVRLSLIYALLDKSDIIRKEHLQAAYDFWKYCELSARQIFCENTGNKLADTIYGHLRSSKIGLSKTDIHKKTKNNYSSDQMDTALVILATNGLAHSHDEKRDESSKSVEYWYPDDCNCYEFNEFNESDGSSKEDSSSKDLGMSLEK